MDARPIALKKHLEMFFLHLCKQNSNNASYGKASWINFKFSLYHCLNLNRNIFSLIHLYFDLHCSFSCLLLITEWEFNVFFFSAHFLHNFLDPGNNNIIVLLLFQDLSNVFYDSKSVTALKQSCLREYIEIFLILPKRVYHFYQ